MQVEPQNRETERGLPTRGHNRMAVRDVWSLTEGVEQVKSRRQSNHSSTGLNAGSAKTIVFNPASLITR